jgi:hypothetical protein
MFRVIAGTAAFAIIAMTRVFGASAAPAAAAVTAQPTSQQLVAEAAAGTVKAHLLGLSPQAISTIPAEQGEAAAVGHGLNIINLFVDFKTSASTFTSRWKSASAGGAVPETTWMPCSFTVGCGSSRTDDTFPLASIAAGTYDSYLTSVAHAARAFGKPIVMRLAHEMNGSWYPWGNGVNGNTPASYVAAWRHVVTVFRAAGATNVYWLWTPNKSGHSLSTWYPGNSYVSFVGVDGYNGPQYSSRWMTPAQVFGSSFAQFPSFTTKPIIIGEVGCVEGSSSFPGSKAVWMTQFVHYLAAQPKAAGFVWSEFNSTKKIDTSVSAQVAMKAALAAQWVSR